MFMKCLSLSGYFILSLICVGVLAFGLSFLLVPHHPVDAYQLLQETITSGQPVTADWWGEVYVPEKHHVRFTLHAEKRLVAFKILFFVLLPLFWGCWIVRRKRGNIYANFTVC